MHIVRKDQKLGIKDLVLSQVRRQLRSKQASMLVRLLEPLWECTRSSFETWLFMRSLLCLGCIRFLLRILWVKLVALGLFKACLSQAQTWGWCRAIISPVQWSFRDSLSSWMYPYSFRMSWFSLMSWQACSWNSIFFCRWLQMNLLSSRQLGLHSSFAYTLGSVLICSWEYSRCSEDSVLTLVLQVREGRESASLVGVVDRCCFLARGEKGLRRYLRLFLMFCS